MLLAVCSAFAVCCYLCDVCCLFVLCVGLLFGVLWFVDVLFVVLLFGVVCLLFIVA